MAGHDRIVVGVGDQPMVHPSAWQAVAGTEETPIAAAVFQGHRAPPTLLESEVWDLLPLIGDEGARGLMRRRPDLVTEVECMGRSLDVDTLADLDKVEGLLQADGVASWT